MAQAKDTAPKDDDAEGPIEHRHHARKSAAPPQTREPVTASSPPKDTASKDSSKDDGEARSPAKSASKPEPKGGALPAGDGPIEYRPKKGVHLTEAGSVAKEAWVGRILGRSVRVYRGAPESGLPPAVRTALDVAGIEVGVVTLEELGIRPRVTGIVNLGQ